MSLANVVAIGGAARSIVLLGDPNQLPQVIPGQSTRTARGVGARAPARRGRTMPPDRGLFLADDVAPASGRLRLHLRGRSTRAASSRTRRRARQRVGPAWLRRGHRDPVRARSPTTATRPRSREEADARRRGDPRPRRDSTGRTATGVTRDLGSTTSSSSRRTTPRSRRSSGESGLRSDGRGSAPSTSSRARRRRSRSTRWRPRRRRMRPAADGVPLLAATA